VDIVVGVVLLGIVVVTLLNLVSRAVSAQAMGEQMQTAAMLIDEQLNLVLARGPDNYASRFPAEGVCEAPFEDYRYRLTFEGGGGGDCYTVRATVFWVSGGLERSETIETLVAPRVGEDTDPVRQPDQVVERPVQ
jgi:hypothetical protein